MTRARRTVAAILAMAVTVVSQSRSALAAVVVVVLVGPERSLGWKTHLLATLLTGLAGLGLVRRLPYK